MGKDWIYLKGRNICGRSFYGRNFFGIYFCDKRPYLQRIVLWRLRYLVRKTCHDLPKLVPQNTVFLVHIITIIISAKISFANNFFPSGSSLFKLCSNIFVNIFASWSKLNSFNTSAIKPGILKVKRNDQRFVEYQRSCSDSRINSRKYKLK